VVVGLPDHGGAAPGGGGADVVIQLQAEGLLASPSGVRLHLPAATGAPADVWVDVRHVGTRSPVKLRAVGWLRPAAAVDAFPFVVPPGDGAYVPLGNVPAGAASLRVAARTGSDVDVDLYVYRQEASGHLTLVANASAPGGAGVTVAAPPAGEYLAWIEAPAAPAEVRGVVRRFLEDADGRLTLVPTGAGSGSTGPAWTGGEGGRVLLRLDTAGGSTRYRGWIVAEDATGAWTSYLPVVVEQGLPRLVVTTMPARLPSQGESRFTLYVLDARTNRPVDALLHVDGVPVPTAGGRVTLSMPPAGRQRPLHVTADASGYARLETWIRLHFDERSSPGRAE
ncbi:MAG: hypothetical protein IRY95_03175, partial [Clostridia bacterium]|nr:hypothetical protein [Clostridia bacterium]